jgi:hypothetical protein
LSEEQRNKLHAMFPAMPQEVFDLWLTHGIDAYGWPFQSLLDSTSGTEWADFLLGRSLLFWSEVKWRLLTLVLKPSIFHPFTVNRVNWIIGNCALGEDTPTANLKNTKQRFWAATSFIRENKTMPRNLVALHEGCDFTVLDGNHRLAAAVFLGLDNNFSFPAWVAMAD